MGLGLGLGLGLGSPPGSGSAQRRVPWPTAVAAGAAVASCSCRGSPPSAAPPGSREASGWVGLGWVGVRVTVTGRTSFRHATHRLLGRCLGRRDSPREEQPHHGRNSHHECSGEDRAARDAASTLGLAGSCLGFGLAHSSQSARSTYELKVAGAVLAK